LIYLPAAAARYRNAQAGGKHIACSFRGGLPLL